MPYSQRDERWRNQRLGTVNGVTLGSDGCYVTSQAQVITHFGYPINPAQLDDIYTNRGFYTAGDLLVGNEVTRLHPDIQTLFIHSYVSVPTNLNDLFMAPDEEVIIGVDQDHNPNNNIQWHFMRVVSWDGRTLIVTDPWYGLDQNFATHYGTNPAQTIVKVIKYKRPGFNTPAPAPAPVPPAPAPAPVPPTPPPAPQIPKGEPIVPPTPPTPTITPEERFKYTPTPQPDVRMTHQDYAAIELDTGAVVKEIPAGSIVRVAGEMERNGIKFTRTVSALKAGRWTGLAEAAYEGKGISIPIRTGTNGDLLLPEPGNPSEVSSSATVPANPFAIWLSDALKGILKRIGGWKIHKQR